MEFRRLLIVYLISQVANVVSGFIFSGIVLAIYSNFHHTMKEHGLITLFSASFFVIVALLNISMFLTLIETYVENKIRVFNNIVKINYILLTLLLIVSSITLITNCDILSFIIALGILAFGVLSINEARSYYKNWVLEEYYTNED